MKDQWKTLITRLALPFFFIIGFMGTVVNVSGAVPYDPGESLTNWDKDTLLSTGLEVHRQFPPPSDVPGASYSSPSNNAIYQDYVISTSPLDHAKSMQIKVHPNPVAEHFNVLITQGKASPLLHVRIRDIMGSIVLPAQPFVNRSSFFSAQGLPPGDYVAELMLAEKVINRKIFLKIR